MKTVVAPCLFVAAFLSLASPLVAATEVRFASHPDAHGDRIVFGWEGDLWSVPAGGGNATRLTSWPGEESRPRLSPDGTTLVFEGSYEGSTALYRMPVDGGEPVRLTWNPGGATPVCWTPDGKRIVFRSFFEQAVSRDPKLYSVGRDGGALESLPVDRGTLASFSADGRKMLYCRRGREEYNWKRYRGGDYVDIWSYDFDANRFEPVSSFVGKNAYPMWIGDRMYYLTDQSGVSNLWVMELPKGEPRPVTKFADSDVMMPSTDGRTIVFLQDGFLHLLDVATGIERKIDVAAPSDRWASRDRIVNPKDHVHSGVVSNDGKTVAMEARGDVFVVSSDPKGQTRNLSDSSATRELHPALSPDGKRVAFFSDRSGEYQLYTQAVAGGPWTELTRDLKLWVDQVLWSPDGKRLLFADRNLDLHVVTVDTKSQVTIPGNRQLKNDEFTWEMGDYAWSPDGRWIAFSEVSKNRNSRIFLYDFEQKKRYPVTSDFYDNLHPSFDRNGDYLYFLSSRNVDVQMDFHEDNHVLSTPYQVMAMALQAGGRPPFLDNEPKEDSGETAKGADDRGKEKDKEGKSSAAPLLAPVRIDIAGIESRIFPLPVAAGNFFHLQAGKGTVLWTSVPKFTEEEYEDIWKPRDAAKWTLHVFEMKERKETKLDDRISSFSLSGNGERLLVRVEKEWKAGELSKAISSKKPGEPISLDRMVYRLDRRAEWRQIFDDCWRWYRDFFYDPGMHGHDWKATGDRYRAWLPFVSSRDELNWVLLQMVGELSVGHTYIGGGDEGPVDPPKPAVFTGLLGADLVVDPKAGLWRFQRIYRPTDLDADVKAPLGRSDIRLAEGNYLLAIGDVRLTGRDDYWRLLQVADGQKVRITVSDGADGKDPRSYEVDPIRSDRRLRYASWVADNIRKVEAASGGRLGYMHITAMGADGVGEFDKYWRAFRYRDGIVIDVRGNGGGWTEYFLIDKLERRQAGFNVLAGMEPFVYPGSVSPRRKYVAISNEHNGSDGEAFITHFKADQLGKVVGVPSWGGLVGIVNVRPTVDGGYVFQPNNAFYGKEGRWWVENHGADPDILIDNDPGSVMSGRDPQLEKAIDTLLADIAGDHPSIPAEHPAYPKK
jgi:tricorn protease